MSAIEHWQEWKSFLGNRLLDAKEKGIGEDAIGETAYQIGDYLANHVDPKNKEQRVLLDLWSVANEEEQHTIARLMVRLVENQGDNRPTSYS